MSRRIGLGGRAPHVVLCDDSGLIFSDDYRAGWREGFEGIGCRVTVLDISPMRNFVKLGGRESVMSMRSPLPKLLAQNVMGLKPDLVFIHHGRSAANDMFIGTLRGKGIRTAVYLCDEPYECGETTLYSKKFGFVFTMDPSTMKLHQMARNEHKNVFYLPPASNVNHFENVPYKSRTGPSVFFLGNGSLVPRAPFLEAAQRMIPGADIRFMSATTKNKDRWVDYKDHPALYGNCKLGLNVHRSPWADKNCWNKRVIKRPSNFAWVKGFPVPDPTVTKKNFGTGFWNDYNLDAHHWNPRFLEMATCGTLVINDDSRTELNREFPYVPQAKDPAHFIELIEHYLEHEDEAEAIGQRCRTQIFKRHTYQHRAGEVLIRVGLREWLEAEPCSFLGAPEGWLTPQDIEQLTARSSSEQTGLSERWSPHSGRSSTPTSGSPNGGTSTDSRTSWQL
jgi:spore maturation protein CgeB